MRYSPVRHSTCGLPRFRVRLACVRHAASVQSEPGSNSSVQSLFHRSSCDSGSDPRFPQDPTPALTQKSRRYDPRRTKSPQPTLSRDIKNIGMSTSFHSFGASPRPRPRTPDPEEPRTRLPGQARQYPPERPKHPHLSAVRVFKERAETVRLGEGADYTDAKRAVKRASRLFEVAFKKRAMRWTDRGKSGCGRRLLRAPNTRHHA